MPCSATRPVSVSMILSESLDESVQPGLEGRGSDA